jgi:hypothetical protein
MSATTSGTAPCEPVDELFYDDVVRQYVDEPRYVRRTRLEETIIERLSRPFCRYVLLVGKPGAGKSGVMAGLADGHPGWLRYFIRRDSTTPLSGGDAVSVLLRIGHQLAARHPELFDPQRLEVVVTQRVAAAGPGASVVGVRIEDLAVSPFHRTAIRVEQHVGDLGGRLVGLDVAHATVEPRLLTEDNLQYLALLDPAAVLAAAVPDGLVVVLVDAMDEALRYRGGMSVLDWLERSPELPPNVRVVLSSRPHPRLETLKGVRAGSLELIELHANDQAVLTDTWTFAARLLTVPDLAARLPDPEAAAKRVARASEGNFAYLRALERGLLAAVVDGNDVLLDRLLGLNVLPAGLGALYSVFLRNARDEIGRLGALDVERPRNADDEVTPAWEGAGQRMVGVLAVARAPLTVEQLMRLGSIRVWKSAAESVVQCLRPLLDEVGPAWRFFHQSVAEFLTGDAAREAPDLLVECSEWHRRVVRAYRGAAEWADVDWEAVDDYGLLHLADHLAELGAEGREQIIALVDPRFRAAARRRFLTDLPFKRLVETALAQVDHERELAEVLANALFLDVVRSHLSSSGSWLAPAVFGLMACVGRFSEAQARIELLPPGEHRFAALQALVACTPAGQRHLLGDHDGVDLLVTAAAEVPMVDHTLLFGLRHREAVEAAALALAPHDVDRALALAVGAEPEWDPHRVHDAVLRAAATARPPSQAPALIERMYRGRAAIVAEAARRADPPERERLLALAESHAEEGELKDQIGALAGLVAAWHPTHPERAEPFASRLRDAVADPGAEESVVLAAVETVQDAAPDLADFLLERIAAIDSPSSWTKIRAVRLWAALGRPEKSRTLAEQVLAYERGLGWYGPADSIADLAVALDAFDPEWARRLADEAEDLISAAAAANADAFERWQIDGTLGQVVQAFRTWAPERALRNARLMDGSWISGGSWDSFNGRMSALACLGIDACETDPDLARQLLEECAPEQDQSTVVGRWDPRLVWGGLFRPAEDTEAGTPSSSRMSNYIAYVSNCINYWVRGREQIPFADPAEVARSMQLPPGSAGSTVSWAGVVAAAVTLVAADDLDAAIDLAGWATDPGERLIAVAAVVAALTAAGDVRAVDALAALGRAAVRLPRYVAELDLAKIDQAPMLSYLDPSARARWEAALLLPPEEAAVSEALATATGSWYLSATLRAQKFVDSLYGPVPEDASAADVVDAIHRALASAEGIPDPIQVDLVRVAAVWALAPWDTDGASQIISAIQHPGRALLARLFTSAASSPDAEALDAAVRAALDMAPPDLPALHRVLAIAMAATWGSEAGKGELADLGVACLEDADPLSAAAGLAMLACCVEESRRAVELVRAALHRTEHVSNMHLRNDVLADLLRPAVLSGDTEVVVTVARRLLDAHWQVLMEGLRRAVDPLVALAGAGVFAQLDRAFRAAQAVVGAGDQAEHLDGVAAPSFRESALVAASPAPGPPQILDPGGLDPGVLYLDGDDLPGMSLVQDSAGSGPDPGDYAFPACDGVSSGLRVWLAPQTEPVWRLVDIRFVFPDAERAAIYHAERLIANSEQNPPVPEAPLTGEDCRVFGGTRQVPMVGIDMTTYFYVFRVGRVVVKLFVAQGIESKKPLALEQVHAIAQRIVTKLATDQSDLPPDV